MARASPRSGPGAVVGERAVLEGGLRTATLRATTRARVAAIAPDQLNPEALEASDDGVTPNRPGLIRSSA